MDRPSEPLLRWLRGQIDARGHNTASLAEKIGVPRAELRKALTGARPMTVDELLAVTNALELTPEELGLVGDLGPAEDAAVAVPEPAQFRNQPEALVRMAFDLGIDSLILADASKLDGWGGPDAVLAQYRDRELPIRLDAAYHRFMDPTYDDDAVTLTLSFDRLYRCRFPWASLARVVFTPFLPEPAPAPAEPPPPAKARKNPAGLRLVT